MSRNPLAMVLLVAVIVSACKDDPTRFDDSLQFVPDRASLLIGDTLSLAERLVDENGQLVSSMGFVWSSSDSLIASVSAAGRVLARDSGIAVITASSASASASMTVEVVPVLTDCNGGGSRSRHTGVIENETWRTANSPHFLIDTVRVTGVLTIEPGVVVYGCSDAVLAAARGQIIAEGNAQHRISFKPADVVRGWRGIRAGLQFSDGGTVVLKFANVEGGGLFASLGVLTIEDSWLRNADAGGLVIHIRRSIVDSGNVGMTGGGTFEETVIRGGFLRLSHSSLPSGPIAINGGRIENSPGIALQASGRVTFRTPNVASSRPLRIVGSRGYPVDVTFGIFKTIWPTREAQDSLLGNVNDTLIIAQGGTGGAIIRRELPWIATCYIPFCGFGIDTLTMEPGASIRLDAGNLSISGKLNATGTAALPIRFSGNGRGIELSGTGQSEIRNAVFSKVFIAARDQHTVTLSQITTNNYISVGSAGSSIADSEIFDVVGLGTFSIMPIAALHLSAIGVRAERIVVRRTSGNNGGGNAIALAGITIGANDVQVQQCEITDNASDGIRVVGGSNVRINDCNIDRNGGLGVNNTGGSVVDARRNWWGDPAGPLAPNGDGVSANVDYAEALPTPRPALRAPASITIAPSAGSVGTADTVRFRAEVRDSNGNLTQNERVIWESSDSTIAFQDPIDPAVFVGSRIGSVTISARLVSDPSIRSTSPLQVTQAAPFFEWQRIDLGANPVRVWGRSRNEVYVTLHPPRVMRFDGSMWSPLPDGPRSLGVLAGDGATDLYLAAAENGDGGAELWNWNGTTWHMTAARGRIKNISPIAPRDLIVYSRKAFGEGGDTLYRYRDSQWTPLFATSRVSFDMFTFARSVNDVYLGGNVTPLQHWDGARVVDVTAVPNTQAMAGTANYVYALSNEFDVDASGYRIRAYRVSGLQSTPLDVPSSLRTVRDMYAASDDFVAAAGNGVYVFDGNRWWPVWTGVRASFYEVWAIEDEIYVVGSLQSAPPGTSPWVLLRGRRR